MNTLKTKVTQYLQNKNQVEATALALYKEVIKALELGTIRIAEKIDEKWVVNGWIKTVILWGFKYGKLITLPGSVWNYCDKDTMPVKQITPNDRIRMVPGGSAIRCGSYVASGTIIMPPAYVNIGAYVDTGCMIDSHALVGSCAQLGKNVHLSAASQIGGVLEPIGAMPVIVEDNVFIGGNCGIYEGTIVKAGAVLGSGVVLNASTPVFDSIAGVFIKKTNTHPLIIPENAVVVAGSRPMNSGFGKENNMHIYCPIIIKYKDAKTSTATALEDMLR
ncbi:2,3,4,5-tetrahydropyridine-2,6-dicarboxylate N-succinyltransferase [Gammaproteobacteria bacterium]